MPDIEKAKAAGPRAEQAGRGKLHDLSLTRELEKKVHELEAEITGRRKVEQEMCRGEETYRLLFENMSQGMVCIDSDARIISANDALSRISGLPIGQLIGMLSSDPRLKAIGEDGSDYPADSLPMLVTLSTGKPVRDMVMGIFNYTDETYHWVSGSAVPMFRPGEDRPYQVYATFDDITDRHLAYKALQESESRTTAILENILDAIWSIDTEFRLIAANNAARRLYNLVSGTTPVEGVDIRSAMPEETADLWTGLGRRVFNGEHISFEKHYELAGSPVDLEFSLSPILSPSGRITGASSFARDITGRKQVERELKKGEELFRKAVQSTSDMVWDWDIGSGHLEWYGDIDGMLGYAAGGFPRTLESWENALHPDDHSRVMAALKRHAESGEIYNVEYRVRRRDGTLRNWIDRGLVIRDEGGRIMRSVGACVDITEHRQSETRARIRRDLALKLAGHLSMETALRHCLDAAIEISGFDTGVIYILDEKGGDFNAACYHGGSGFLLEHYSVLKAGSVDARLIKKGLPLYVKAEEFTPPFDEQLRPEGLTFDATIPVLYQDKVIASLGVFSHTQDNMPTAIRESLEAIAADIGVIIDRLASRQALQASENRYRFITDHATDVIWVLDKRLCYTFISPSVTRLRGYTVEEAMERDVTQHITPASLHELTKALESGSIPQLGETAGPEQWFTLELEMSRKDGSTVWMETSMTAMTDDKGEFNGLLGISRDITLRKQMENKLVGSEQRYRSLFEHNPSMVYAIDRQGQFTSINAAAVRITGYSEQEAVSRDFADGIAPEYLETVKRNFAKSLNGEPQSYEAAVIAKDGRRIDIHITSTPIIVDGEVTGVYGIADDITGRKQMEKLLRDSEEKYRTVVENMHDVLYRTDNKGDVTLVSPSVTRLLGVESADQVIGKNLGRDFYANQEDLIHSFKLLEANGEVVDLEINVRRPDGKIITVAANSHIYRDAGGQPVGFEGVIRDITQRKKAEEELRAALEMLGSSLESTIDAIAMMSELRDPYTAGHQRRVTRLALAIAVELGLPDGRMQPLRVAGLLHDVGKIYVPSEILSKPGQLTGLEMALARAHATAGYDVVAAIKFPWPIADIVAQHHERMDGSGYPAGLKGDEITLEARIIAVADVTEAMMSHRPYRPSLGMDKALAEITANRGRLYDEAAVDACIKLLTEKGFKFPD